MSRKIQVPPSGTLLTRDYIDALAATFRRLPVSRREAMEWGTQQLYDWTEFGGTIFTGESELIDIYPGILDAAHGEASDGEWISEQRRRGNPGRRPRQTLLGRLQLWDSIFRIAGVPAGIVARRQEVAETREVLSTFTDITRARYVNEVRKLRQTHTGAKAVYFSAAMKRLRIRLAEEAAVWKRQQ